MLDDVLGALARAHAAGIVHRDIKPGNVLVAQSNTMKVADFGIAKAPEPPYRDRQIIGTMAYMSPARVAGAPASVADDLYALGVMAYEALIGRRPFPRRTPCRCFGPYWTTLRRRSSAVRRDVDCAVGRDQRSRDGPRRVGGLRSADQMRAALAGTAPSGRSGGTQGRRPATKVLAEPMFEPSNMSWRRASTA